MHQNEWREADQVSCPVLVGAHTLVLQAVLNAQPQPMQDLVCPPTSSVAAHYLQAGRHWPHAISPAHRSGPRLTLLAEAKTLTIWLPNLSCHEIELHVMRALPSYLMSSGIALQSRELAGDLSPEAPSSSCNDP